MDIPNEIKVSYFLIGFMSGGHSACRISKLVWKTGKETGGNKTEEPHSLKSREMAERSFIRSGRPFATPSRTARASHELRSWTASA